MPKANEGPRLKLNRATGIYFIHWTENGRSKRRSTRASDRGFAEQVLAAFLTLEAKAERLAAATGPLLVMDVLGDPDAPGGEDYWHEHILPNPQSDKVSARQAIKKLTRHFGALAVADITPGDVDGYVEARQKGRIGRPSVNHTISKELSYLNAAISHAWKMKRMKKGDAPFIRLPGVSPPRERALEVNEFSALLDAARWPSGPRAGPKDKLPRVYRFIALAYGTAGRKTSVQELQRYQVDRQRDIIDLNKKGRKQTKKRRAKVKISDWLRPIIDRILEQIPEDPDAYLLDHPGCIYTAFDNAVERAGLSDDVTPHVLRHTRATHMAMAGADLWAIADVLADTVATVEKTYAHLHPDFQTGAVNAGPVIAQPLRVVGGKG